MLLEKLQIYGYSRPQEQAVLANMLVGEACLLMGPPGVAKTELVAAIGAALREDTKREYPNDKSKWFTYQVYDASKLNFEDLCGFPNVQDLQATPPKVTYIPTQSSIWGKHLIAFDELNRCSEDRQANLFEIIRSRKLYGNATNNKFIFSTINPFGDIGTIQMSDALVDRHLFYLRIDRFEAMTSANRKKVISRVGNTEALGIRHWGNTTEDLDVSEEVTKDGQPIINEKLANVGKMMRELFVRAANYYTQLNNSISGSLTEIVDKIVEAMAREFATAAEGIKKEVSISGRRASSIRRGILAVRAIQLAEKKDNEDIENLMSTIINVCKMCLPIGIGGKLDQNTIATANKVIDTTVNSLWPNIKEKKNTLDIDKIAVALNTKNPIKILDTILSTNMNQTTKDTLFSSLLNKELYTIPGTTNVDTEHYNRIQALMYGLSEEITDFIPKHLKIDSNAAQLAEAVKTTTLEVEDIFVSYVPMIAAIAESYKKNPIAYMAYKTGFMYYQQTVETEADAIQALAELNRLVKLITEKITAHKEHNAKANDSSKTSQQTPTSAP